MARLIGVYLASAFLLPCVLVASDYGGGEIARQAAPVVCEFGCWDVEDEACHQGLTKDACAQVYGHVEWSEKCNCCTKVAALRGAAPPEPAAADVAGDYGGGEIAHQTAPVVCEFGCWDQEDEACHQGLTQDACAQVYGQVEWSEKCNCRTKVAALGGAVPPEPAATDVAVPDDNEAKLLAAPAMLYTEAIEALPDGHSLITCHGAMICPSYTTDPHGVRECNGSGYLCHGGAAVLAVGGRGGGMTDGEEVGHPEEAQQMEKEVVGEVQPEVLVAAAYCRGGRVCRGRWTWAGRRRVCRGGFYCRSGWR